MKEQLLLELKIETPLLTPFQFENVFIESFDLTKIKIQKMPANKIVFYQKIMSKAVWRPAPGRKLGFIVLYENNILGLIFLASPVINLSARDEFLSLPKDPSLKGKELRHYADLSVCVASQPFGWYWNGGKLLALIATTLGNYWQEQYGDELKGIITTSLFGKSSQYNRVYKMLGYTKGFGHEHISDNEYKKMMNWMKENNFPIPSSSFGSGSNPRMRRIIAYRKASGDKSVKVQHGLKRGIYYHETQFSTEEIIKFWYDRWGKNRFDRNKDLKPPYTNGKSDNAKI